MVSLKDRALVLFYLSEWSTTFRHLSHLLDRGYSLQQALEIVIDRPSPGFILDHLHQIHSRLQIGYPILESLAPTLSILMSYSFSPEHHIPDLSRFFLELSNSLQRRNDTGRILAKELSYPTFLLVSFIGFFIFFYIFILPLFSTFFSNFNLPVPAPILFLQSLQQHPYSPVDFFRILSILLLIVILLAYLGNVTYRKMVFPYSLSIFFRGWAILLQSGISLKKSLLIYPPTYLSPPQLERFQRQLLATGDIISELSSVTPFSKSSLSLLSSGLSSGRFSESLSQLSDEYHQLAFLRISHLIRLIKPSLLLLFGLLVLIMVQLLFLPLIQGISTLS